MASPVTVEAVLSSLIINMYSLFYLQLPTQIFVWTPNKLFIYSFLLLGIPISCPGHFEGVWLRLVIGFIKTFVNCITAFVALRLLRPCYTKQCYMRQIFLATCNAFVALQEKNSPVTPHFATAIVALWVASKVERPSTFCNIARQAACV